MARNKKLTDAELVSIINQEMSQADYEGQSVLSQQRSQADLAYTSEYTNGVFPTTGMSSIVINTLQPAVDTLTTYITKLFCSDRETVIFSPRDSDLYGEAEEITKIVNDIIHKDNNGYEIINRWVKDAALHKNGIVKVVWNDTPKVHKELFDGTEEEFNVWVSLKEEEGLEVEIISEDKKVDTMEIDPKDGSDEILELSRNRSEYKVKVIKETGDPKIINIPPEEFLINEGATSINGDQLTRFVCHRQLTYVSDVVSMFPKVKADELTGSGFLENEYETQTRSQFDGTYTQNDQGATSGPMRQVEVAESWIRVDVNGNGTADWHHIFTSGNTVLMSEEWFGPIPMCSFTFFPIPHKFYGLSVWDKLRDYHITKTALVRSEIDSGVQRNTIRIIADPRKISVRDLKSGRPGIIKVKPGFEAKDVMPLNIAGSAGGGSVAMLQYLDKEIMAQIGIDPVSGMVSSDIEKSGNDAEKTSMTMDNASVKVEMFAREFAETGLRDMVWAITDLLVQNGQIEDSGLSKADLRAKVGLGHQTIKQKLQGAQAIIQQQAMLESNPTNPVSIPAEYKLNASVELAFAMGYEDASKFFPTPEKVDEERARIAKAAEAQQQQNMKMQEVQMQQQSALNETTMALNAAKAQKATVEAQSAERNQELKEEQAVTEIDNMKADNDLNLRRVELEEERTAEKIDLDKDRLHLDMAMADDESEKGSDVTHR